MIAEVEKALITLDEYFDKINNKMIKNLDKIENETENIETEINRQLQYIETYRCVLFIIFLFYFNSIKRIGIIIYPSKNTILILIII